MRILLDECIPQKLKNSFFGHDCRTVPEEGLAGTRNGELLAQAEKLGFAVFLSLDRGIEYQQNLGWRSIVVIRAKTNRLVDLLVHVPEILSVLDTLQPGKIVKVG